MSRNSSGSSLDRKILPDGWSVQVAEDGVTCFYYNHRTGKMQYEHPMLSDTEYDSHDDEAALGASDDSYSDIDEDKFHDARETHYDSAMKPNRLSLDSLPANVDTPETVVSDASPHVRSRHRRRRSQRENTSFDCMHTKLSIDRLLISGWNE